MADQTETNTKPKITGFDLSTLSTENQKYFTHVKDRILELQQVRINHYNKNLDQLWADADREYLPHRLQTSGRKVIATDEDKGWRGSMVTLGTNNWQSDLSQSNVYVKIQTALSILIDQNPSGIFTPTTKKYQATSELIKQLYERSWEYAKSKAQLKLFVFNLAKYGWAVARTYPKRIVRDVKVITEYDEENPEKSVYETKKVEVYNDIFRENLDPRNTWIDDQAKPNGVHSVNDGAWRKVYDIDDFKEEFASFKNVKFVQAGGVTDEVLNVTSLNKTKVQPRTSRLVEVYFYENLRKDMFWVVANGVPVVMEPLPISDSTGNKKLSLWQTFWTLRHAESPYGVGIYEAMRYDQALKDRFRNMTIDQITLSIYKMFFYQGTGQLTETGDITIQPGVGKQVLDPKNINFLTVPGPGQDAYLGMQMIDKDLDEVSGITDALQGNITGKTAFELAQAKEAALKRLKDPLDNILEALNNEGYITVSLIQLLYSIPETYEISDPQLIEDYLKEIQSDPDLYERDEANKFIAKVYPEFPLNLEKDEQDNLIETNDTRFFRLKPKMLSWEGIVNIKSESILSPSEQIDRALESEMYGQLVPMLSNPMGPQIFGKMAKELVKSYNKDPRDFLPDAWLQASQTAQPGQPGQPLQPPQGENGEQPLFVSANGAPAGAQPGGQTPPPPPTPGSEPPAQAMSGSPSSIVGSVVNKMNPFSK